MLMSSGIIGKDWLDILRPGLFDFGAFTTVSPFDIAVMPLFLGMGILGKHEMGP